MLLNLIIIIISIALLLNSIAIRLIFKRLLNIEMRRKLMRLHETDEYYGTVDISKWKKKINDCDDIRW